MIPSLLFPCMATSCLYFQDFPSSCMDTSYDYFLGWQLSPKLPSVWCWQQREPDSSCVGPNFMWSNLVIVQQVLLYIEIVPNFIPNGVPHTIVSICRKLVVFHIWSVSWFHFTLFEDFGLIFFYSYVVQYVRAGLITHMINQVFVSFITMFIAIEIISQVLNPFILIY